jgi:hypothetical protein
MRDRLRAVNCPSDMINQIGGWSKQSIGETYGEGYKLENLNTYLLSVNASNLDFQVGGLCPHAD